MSDSKFDNLLTYTRILNNPHLVSKDSEVLKPTYSQAFRWFREKFKHLKFFVKEEDFREGLYEYDIKDVLCVSGFKSYEEAELSCLKKLIEIVKEK
jgi:hypothetical protein